MEYYFSDENLPTDEFMLKFVKKNKDGFGKYCANVPLLQDVHVVKTLFWTYML